MSIRFFPGNLIFLKEVYENAHADEKKHLPQGQFHQTGTLHTRSGARTLKRGMEKKINEESGLTEIDSRNKMLMLSYPIWQRKDQLLKVK